MLPMSHNGWEHTYETPHIMRHWLHTTIAQDIASSHRDESHKSLWYYIYLGSSINATTFQGLSFCVTFATSLSHHLLYFATSLSHHLHIRGSYMQQLSMILYCHQESSTRYNFLGRNTSYLTNICFCGKKPLYHLRNLILLARISPQFHPRT